MGWGKTWVPPVTPLVGTSFEFDGSGVEARLNTGYKIPVRAWDVEQANRVAAEEARIFGSGTSQAMAPGRMSRAWSWIRGKAQGQGGKAAKGLAALGVELAIIDLVEEGQRHAIIAASGAKPPEWQKRGFATEPEEFSARAIAEQASKRNIPVSWMNDPSGIRTRMSTRGFSYSNDSRGDAGGFQGMFGGLTPFIAKGASLAMSAAMAPPPAGSPTDPAAATNALTEVAKQILAAILGKNQPGGTQLMSTQSPGGAVSSQNFAWL